MSNLADPGCPWCRGSGLDAVDTEKSRECSCVTRERHRRQFAEEDERRRRRPEIVAYLETWARLVEDNEPYCVHGFGCLDAGILREAADHLRRVRR